MNPRRAGRPGPYNYELRRRGAVSAPEENGRNHNGFDLHDTAQDHYRHCEEPLSEAKGDAAISIPIPLQPRC
jgi:hypothetical protein